MAHKFALHQVTVDLIEKAKAALNHEVENYRSQWDDMSPAWQAGDRSQAVQDWLDSLEEVANTMGTVECDPWTQRLDE